MSRDIVIVSGADAAYAPLLEDWIASLDAAGWTERADIAVLDLGLDAATREKLRARGIRFAEPGWDVAVPDALRATPWFRACTARPFLPRHFPGHDLYVWIDADAWVQDAAALDLLVETARTGRVAACSHTHSSYRASPNEYKVRGAGPLEIVKAPGLYHDYTSCFGRGEARRLAHLPYLNCGVFAAAADSPLWPAWQRDLAAAIARWPHFCVEQLAMNRAVHLDGLPLGLLPARCNWQCHLALPAVADDGTLVDPEPPYERIGIVHMSAGTRDGVHRLARVAGGTVARALTHRAATGAS